MQTRVRLSIALVAALVALAVLAWVVLANSSPGGFVAAVDASSGRSLYTTKVDGASVQVRYADRDVVIAEKRRCGSESRRYEAGDTAVIALGARDGREIWAAEDTALPWGAAGSLALAGPGPIVTGTFAPTRGIPGDESTSLQGVDPMSGHVRWRRSDVDRWLVEAIADHVVVVDNNTAFTGGPPSQPHSVEVAGWNRETGETLWTVVVDEEHHVEAVSADGGFVAIATVERSFGTTSTIIDIRVLAADTGELVNAFSISTGKSDPHVVDLQVLGSTTVVLDDTFTLRGYNTTGTQVWEQTVPVATRLVEPAQRDVLVADTARGNAAITAFAVTTGETLWTKPSASSPASDGPTLAFAVYPDALRAVETSSGSDLWRAHVAQQGDFLIGGGGNYYASGGCPERDD